MDPININRTGLMNTTWEALNYLKKPWITDILSSIWWVLWWLWTLGAIGYSLSLNKKPKIKIDLIDPQEERDGIDSNSGKKTSTYLKITNNGKKEIINCECFITKIEKEGAGGKWIDFWKTHKITEFSQKRLTWKNNEQKIEINENKWDYIYLVSLWNISEQSESDNIEQQGWWQAWNNIVTLYIKPGWEKEIKLWTGKFRIHVCINAKNLIREERIKIERDWNKFEHLDEKYDAKIEK